jgi:hypothetical protein
VRLQILVSQDSVAGGVRYSYTVVNRSAFELHHVFIGYDAPTDSLLFTASPAGWSVDSLPAASVSAPMGWDASFDVDGSGGGQLDFAADSTHDGIPRGRIQSGFTVTLAAASDEYRATRWVVFTDEGRAYTGVLEDVARRQTVDSDRPGRGRVGARRAATHGP